MFEERKLNLLHHTNGDLMPRQTNKGKTSSSFYSLLRGRFPFTRSRIQSPFDIVSLFMQLHFFAQENEMNLSSLPQPTPLLLPFPSPFACSAYTLRDNIKRYLQLHLRSLIWIDKLLLVCCLAAICSGAAITFFVYHTHLFR